MELDNLKEIWKEQGGTGISQGDKESLIFYSGPEVRGTRGQDEKKSHFRIGGRNPAIRICSCLLSYCLPGSLENGRLDILYSWILIPRLFLSQIPIVIRNGMSKLQGQE